MLKLPIRIQRYTETSNIHAETLSVYGSVMCSSFSSSSSFRGGVCLLMLLNTYHIKKAFHLQTVSSFQLDETMDIYILLVMLLAAFAMLGFDIIAKQTITILARGNKENAKRRYCCSILHIHSLLLFPRRRLRADTVSQLCFVFWCSGTAATVIPLTRSQANVVLKIAFTLDIVMDMPTRFQQGTHLIYHIEI